MRYLLIITAQVLKVTQIRINNFQDIGEKLKELGAPLGKPAGQDSSCRDINKHIRREKGRYIDYRVSWSVLIFVLHGQQAKPTYPAPF